jgi:hypothetical protein
MKISSGIPDDSAGRSDRKQRHRHGVTAGFQQTRASIRNQQAAHPALPKF